MLFGIQPKINGYVSRVVVTTLRIVIESFLLFSVKINAIKICLWYSPSGPTSNVDMPLFYSLARMSVMLARTQSVVTAFLTKR